MVSRRRRTWAWEVRRLHHASFDAAQVQLVEERWQRMKFQIQIQIQWRRRRRHLTDTSIEGGFAFEAGIACRAAADSLDTGRRRPYDIIVIGRNLIVKHSVTRRRREMVVMVVGS